ncbi:hypothetical protein Tco_0317506 [Tanacetum coccineum]
MDFIEMPPIDEKHIKCSPGLVHMFCMDHQIAYHTFLGIRCSLINGAISSSRKQVHKYWFKESGTDLDGSHEHFSRSYSELLLIQLELVCIGIFDLLDCIPESMHIYFRHFSGDQENGIAGREFKNIQSDLICGFSLWLAELNSYVAFFNLESFLGSNQSFVKSNFLSDFRKAVYSH